MYLLGALVIKSDTILRENELVVPMVLSDDGKTITVNSTENMNSMVVVPIYGPVPSGPFARCVKLPLVMTIEEPEEPTGLNYNVKSMYSVYPTVTDGELNISGFGGTAFVYDVNGNMVQALDCSNNTRFDLSALNSGTIS